MPLPLEAQAHANVDHEGLHDVDRALKCDASRAGNYFAESLPFSPQLNAALAGFVRRNL
jgi:hypothetical protein